MKRYGVRCQQPDRAQAAADMLQAEAFAQVRSPSLPDRGGDDHERHRPRYQVQGSAISPRTQAVTTAGMF